MTERKLVGHDNFVRHNPMTDKFDIDRFHHVEFWCSDAINVAKRFMFSLGMNMVAKSDLTTGNKSYCSYVVNSGDLTFVFTAPYAACLDREGSVEPHPGYDKDTVANFIVKHGLAVRAISIRCKDAAVAYERCVASGGTGVFAPQTLVDRDTGKSTTMSEIKLYGDTVIRWISGDFTGRCLPNYDSVAVTKPQNFGIYRVDHIVSNVPKLFEAVDYLMGTVGFHEFSEFTAEDVGTVDSGLNSMVLASNNEYVLLPVNEPTFGTRRKSQIQTFLEHNDGPGVQHIALKTDDIFYTISEMRKRGEVGGFDFMPAPGPDYYARIPSRIGEDTLTAEQLARVQELGLLVDKDDQGVLIQVFTQPTGDRPTVFMEIIERIGCDVDEATGEKKEQAAGCGGFGKGNFSELFKSIENYEKLCDVKR